MYAMHFTGIGAASLAVVALVTAGVNFTIQRYGLLNEQGRRWALLISSFGLLGVASIYYDLGRRLFGRV